MDPANAPAIGPRRQDRRWRFGLSLYQVLFGWFVLNLLLVLGRLAQPGWLTGVPLVPESLLVILGLAVTLSSFLRELPAQNVFLASVVIAGLSFAADLVCAAVGLPYAQSGGRRVPAVAFVWALPLIRLFEILNSRSLARLLLRSRRRHANYGWWVLGLTVLLAVIFEMNLTPLATAVGGYWSWKPEPAGASWYGMPWLALGAWALAALAITALVTPSLINKRPGVGGVEIQPDGDGLGNPSVPTGDQQSVERGKFRLLGEPNLHESESTSPHPCPLPKEREPRSQSQVTPRRGRTRDALRTILPLLGERAGVRGSLGQSQPRVQYAFARQAEHTAFWTWASPNLLFLAVAGSHELWPAAIVILVELVLLGALILRNNLPRSSR